MTDKKIPIILDGDPGHDDAIGWVIAHGSKKFDIKAITAVNGNCSVDKAAYNSQRICSLIHLDVPIAKGQSKPLYIESLAAPANIHGESGLDGPALPEPNRALENETAVELMIKVLEEADEPITIVSTGPLTNAAGLLLARPDLKNKIKAFSIMGGGIMLGNWTPAAEFNILIDPQAADIVFSSGVPIYMAGLDVTEKALVTPEDVEVIRSIGNPVSNIVAEWLDFFAKFHLSIGYQGAPMHDPCAVMVLIHPEVFELKEMYVQIETSGEYTKGMTVGDYYGVTGKKPNATVLMNVNREAFIAKLVEYIKAYSQEDETK